MYIDTHCHLNDAQAYPNPQVEIDAAKEAGVDRMIVIGTRPDEWQSTIELVEAHPELCAVVGWHPNYTADYDHAKLGDLEACLAHPRVLALGEIGLDYHWDYSPRDTQARALRDQLDLAESLGMPVVFHAREAYGDLLDILESRGPAAYLLHCFAGNQEDAERAVRLGAYFGVDGPITYKKADDLRAVIKAIPPDRLVIETDAPYMSPVPFRGKPNRPAYVPLINQALAAVLGISAQECADTTTANAKRFFALRD